MARAERHSDNDLIVIETTWAEKELIKLIPGTRWDARAKFWTAPLSWAVCVQLRGVFGTDLTVGPRLTEWSWREFQERVAPALDLREQVERDDLADENLYQFQEIGARFMADVAGDSLLSDELGLGKTITTLAALGREDGLPALVICPNSVKTGWETQARKWYPDATPYVVTGGAQTRRKLLSLAHADPAALVIINIESVRLFSRLSPFGNVALKKCRECDPTHGEERLTASRCEVHRKELNDFHFKTVIIDEAHRIKEPKAAQTRAVWAVCHGPTVRRRWALTGTPVANNIADLWSIMHAVAPYEWPTKSKWVDRYALSAWNPFGGLDIVGINPQTRDEFHKIFHPRFRRTPKALVLSQLPKVVRSTRWVDMVPKQEKAYRELEKRLVTRLDDGDVLVAPNNLVKATRLLQLSSSYASVEWVERPLTVESKCSCYGYGLDAHVEECKLKYEIKVTLTEPSPKLDALEEVMSERGDAPLVVGAMSRQLIMLAADRLTKAKIPHGLIVGGVSDWERKNAIEQFQRDELQVMLLTLQAGGTGVDGLQHSDTMIYLQRSWSMLVNVQGDGRVHRIGSEKHDSVHIIDIVTSNSVEEEALFPRLERKFEQLEEINRDRERLIAAGVTPDKLFVLEEREQRIIDSDLGVPIIEEATT